MISANDPNYKPPTEAEKKAAWNDKFNQYGQSLNEGNGLDPEEQATRNKMLAIGAILLVVAVYYVSLKTGIIK